MYVKTFINIFEFHDSKSFYSIDTTEHAAGSREATREREKEREASTILGNFLLLFCVVQHL